MSTIFLIYILMTIPTLGEVLGLVGFLTFVVSGFFFMMYVGSGEGSDDYLKGKKWFYRTFTIACVATFMCIVIPSKQTSYILAGAYVAEKTVSSEIGQDVISLVHKNIKDALKESK